MTSHRIGVNLRVSGNCDQGARKYMEDNHVIKFLKKDTDDYEFAYFGIFDGHGGPEASAFCRDNLLNEITKYDGFWTDDDDQVLAAIRKGFLDTHHAMWNVLDSWPKTVTGLPSTAGTTATIAIIKQGKLYTGHVGDSALVLGENDEYGGGNPVQAICITKEHKPDDPDERLRIEDAGGEVINKSGVPRVVWSRPKTNHKGPVRRSTQIDQIPFLAVARSLGDLWSYDYYTETYVVSPDPDIAVLKLDPNKHRCLILASDGLWNMLTPEESVNMVMDLEAQFEQKIINDPNVAVSFWSNPAERLVSRALNKWRSKALKADNTSCVVVLIDPLGPSKLTLLKRKRQELLSGGEITNCQLNKVPRLPDEQRVKSRNKNANCSLSDSHIRVTDDSIIQPVDREPNVLRRSFIVGAKSGAIENSCNESINDSVQYIPKSSVKWNLRHSVDSAKIESLNASNLKTNDHYLRRIPPHPSVQRQSLTNLYSTESQNHKDGPVYTKLLNNKALARGSEDGKLKKPWELVHEMGVESKTKKDGIDHFKDYDIEVEADSDSLEKTIPQPPPCTPCSDAKEIDRGNESDGENSLQSSADITNKAFSLASDESIESPSSGDDNQPPTPRSAPAKLSSSKNKRGHISKSVKRKLARSGRKLQHPLRPPTNIRPHQMSPPRLASPPKRVLNTSKSMNDVATPKNLREVTRTISCTGLTPEMSMLLSKRSKQAINSTHDACTGTSDITTHLLSSLMAADMANVRSGSTLRSRHDASTIVDEFDDACLSSISQADHLKQLNKTGPIKKSGSKRWGNFLRASKLGIDNMFHRKESGPCKLTTTSTGKLERSISKPVHSKNTSVSTSRIADLALSNNLPDITVSHFADLTVDVSTLTAGDLTTLSADDSMLSAADLTMAHHSMLEDGLQGKVIKSRKGFLQKTRVTLRRARKAAKKAFFPENHRLFSQKSSGSKRKSDEFLPASDMKRRRQLEVEKV